jgi:hypothetical protein
VGSVLGGLAFGRKRNKGGPAGGLTGSTQYADSWGQLNQGIQSGQDPTANLMQILNGFKGRPGDLEGFMQQAMPFLQASAAQQIKGGAGYKFAEDPNNWDGGAMAGYGTAAGAIGTGAARATQQNAQGLASMGLGRSGARAMGGAVIQQNAAAQQGDLWSRTYQQAQQNRMNSALQSIDTNRSLAMMALGGAATPRISDGGGGRGGGMMGIGAGAAGGAAAGAAGGPVGAGIGALAGGLASFFGQRAGR